MNLCAHPTKYIEKLKTDFYSSYSLLLNDIYMDILRKLIRANC